MIKMVRVDYRLIHGQVAVSWTSSLGVDAILLVSDTLENDPIRKETLLLAKPTNVKLIAKNTQEAIDVIKSGKTDDYKVFIVCETIQSAAKIAEAFDIKEINLGNVAFSDGKKKLDKAIYVNDEEMNVIRDLVNKGHDVFLQMVPSERKIQAAKLI
ncbi:PTS sugar transporter subunit IIB [Enterococcus faecium]|uniref:PTS sugar transporter subunit IIB n=1 Tax=Enterococcus faecium TaxID=1352 RepID=UPI004043EE26